MLEITRLLSTDETAIHALSGEITVDQLERIETLIHDASERNESITFDLRHVWRIERNAAFLIARQACGPNHQVHFVGVPGGLREWLRAVAEEVPSTKPRRWREGGAVMEILSRNWGWVVLRGVVAILFGVLTMFQPAITLAALVLLFGAYAVTDGVAMIVWAVTNRRDEPHWVSLIVGGVLGIAAGIVTFLWPAMTTVALLFVIATWAIVMGVATIAAAIGLRKVLVGEWRLVVSGLLSVALGVVLLAAPAAGALAMVIWIGGYAVASGVVLIALGFQLRSLYRSHPNQLMSHPA